MLRPWQQCLRKQKGKKAPATTFPALLFAKVKALGGDETKVHCLTWGCHRATNEYQHIKHVVLVGLLQAPLSSIIAIAHGTSGKPMSATVSPMDIETLRMSRIISDTLQAVGRGAIREMTFGGDVPSGCTLDVIASSVGPMGFKEPVHTLATMFPGAKVKRWYPRVATAKRDMNRAIADAAHSLIGEGNEVLVTSGDWARKAGYRARTLQRSMNTGLVRSLLGEEGFTVRKQGGRWLIRRESNSGAIAAA
jgi:hypothetical protein